MKTTSLRPYLSNLTAKGYSTLFTGKEDKIKLCLIDEQYLNELNIPDNGEITYKNNWLKPVDFEQILKPIAEYDIDLPLMQAVYSVFYQSLMDGNSILDNNTLTIKSSTLASYMNAASRNDGYKTFWNKLSEFNKVYASLPNGEVSKFLTLINFSANMNELEFDVKLLRQILNLINDDNEVTVKKAFKKEFTYELPTHSFLIHSSINRKNRNAYFIVTQIEALLVQAGEKAPEVHIKFENLIEKVPTLKQALKDKTTANKNNVLKRTFKKTYELLKTNTDIYKYYNDFKINEVLPTTTTLDECLTMTHKGINKDYKQKM